MFEKVCYGVLTISAATMVVVVLTSRVDDANPPMGGLVPGGSVPPLEVQTNDGAVEAVGPEASGRTFIVFFNTECVYCRESIPTYREVARGECDLRVVFVVSDRHGDDLHDWWSANAWDPEEGCAEVLVGSPGRGAAEYGIRVTPTHILVEDAVVMEQRMGVLQTVPEWLVGRP